MTDHTTPRGYAVHLMSYLTDDADIAMHVNRNWGTNWKADYVAKLRRTDDRVRPDRRRKESDHSEPISYNPIKENMAVKDSSRRLLAALWKYHADYISARGAVR